MKLQVLVCLAVLSVGSVHHADGFKILGIFPTMAKSHFIVGNALMEGLAKAGHEVTVLSSFAPSKIVANYTHVHAEGIFEYFKRSGEARTGVMDNLLNMHDQPISQMIKDLYGMGITISNFTLNHPVTKKFLATDQHFDAIILEMFLSESLLGFAHRFNAPIIAMSTFGASKWTTDLVGSPSPLSYVPHTFLSFTDKMSFLERLGNIAMSTFETAYMSFNYLPVQNEIYEANFPNPKPSLAEAMKNVNLVLLNSHFTLGYPRPYVPNMIEVGGLHINRVPNPLPKDIKDFLDDAKDGVIYFSMGSNIQSTTLPVEKRDALLKTFASFKQKVMWKWESDDLPGKSDNVFTKAWWPQDDILAHRNVKVFITHGGLLGSSEAIYHGVPVIGIPIFGDQELNMARAQRAGYGLTVNYRNLTQEALTWALNEVLTDPKFSENAKTISRRYRDQPKRPLDTAIYWVEYIARHNGAPHIHCAGQDLSFLVYHNLDIFLAILAIKLFFFFLIKRCCCGSSKKVSLEDASKRKKKLN